MQVFPGWVSIVLGTTAIRAKQISLKDTLFDAKDKVTAKEEDTEKDVCSHIVGIVKALQTREVSDVADIVQGQDKGTDSLAPFPSPKASVPEDDAIDTKDGASSGA